MSIRGKLMAIMMGISGIAILLTVTAITLYLIYDMRQSRIRELEVSATIMADRNKAALLFLDDEQAQSNLQVFASDPNIIVACLYDEGGQLFSGYVNPVYAMHHCPSQERDTTSYLQDELSVAKQVHAGQGRIGSVHLASDLKVVNDAVQRIALISAVITCVVFVIVLILTMYLQRSVSAPIVKLMHAVRSIARDKDYSIRVPQSSRQDEVGALARSFNEMVEEIEVRDMDLLEVNDNLEHMVQERTQDLEAAKKKAEFASEAKSEFLRNMSHEFRTPLHAMTSFSAYGIKEAGSTDAETLKGYFNIIQTSAERLNKLVDEVLNLSRLESGQQRYDFHQRSLQPVLEHCIKSIESLTKDKGVNVIFEEPEHFSTCAFDQDRITQVLTNILGNAVKFTPTGKTIRLRYEEQENDAFESKRPMVFVSVQDEGVGIPEDELNKIFDSFVQSSRTNQGAGGTGLGLAISRNIIRAHEGMIFASNNEQGGASFTFSFPRDLTAGEKVIDVQPTSQQQ